jgi:hypothetical protein
MKNCLKSTAKIVTLVKTSFITISIFLACITIVTSEETTMEPVILSTNDITLSSNGNAISSIHLNNATHVAIVSLTIIWDPAVINLSGFDASMSPFDLIQKNINNENGYIHMDSYDFAENGLAGNFTMCNLTFTAAEQSHHGDWCSINLSSCTVWNVYQTSEPEPDIVEVPALTINATAIINTINLDIYQLESDRGFPIRHAVDGDWGAAQSFLPTVDVLTNFSMLIGKFGSPNYDLIVELRKDAIDGPLLDTVDFSPDSIPPGKHWLNIDIEDVGITPGSSYYIVLPSPPSTVTNSYGYEWAYAYENQYSDGSFWFTRNSGNLWRELPTVYDFTFQSYGYFD